MVGPAPGSGLELKVGMTVHAHSWFTNTDAVDYFISNPVLAGENGAEVPTSDMPQDPDREVAERFAVVEPHLAAGGIDLLHHRADGQSTQAWDCNWKLAIINAMESYHLFKVHPSTLEPYAPTRGGLLHCGLCPRHGHRRHDHRR